MAEQPHDIRDKMPQPSTLAGSDAIADLPLRRAQGLLHGSVRGQIFVHNPNGYDALALLSARTWQFLQLADGRSARELAHAVAPGNAPAIAALLNDVKMLLRNGFVHAPGIAAYRPAQAPRTFNAWLHLTNSCNLACPYCYIHKNSGHMSSDVAAQLLISIEQTARSGDVDRIHVRFAGGEPMLRFAQLQQFYADAKQLCLPHGVEFSAAILTNGTVLPKGAARWLQENHVQVSVSIDGIEELQDVMRPVVGGGSSFARLKTGLQSYLDHGIRPYILITVGQSNLEGLPALTQWLLELGLGFRYSLVRDLEWGSGLLDDRHGAAEALDHAQENAPIALLSGEPLRQMQRIFGHCYDLIEKAMLKNQEQGQAFRPSFRQTHKFCDLQPWQPIRKACGAGSSYVAISETGAVSPCQAALHHPATSPLTATSLLKQAREQSQFSSFERKSGNAECNRCRHKPSCAGGCPLLLHRREGHIDGRSPYCEVFRAVLPRIVELAALELLLQRQGRMRADNSGLPQVAT